MPVQEAVPYSEAIGNGVSSSFALGFPCNKKEYLIVKVNDIEVSDSDWQLHANTVAFNTPPAVDAFIQFKRETKIERTTDYATFNDSLRGDVLNKDFDKVYEILQENKADTSQYKPDYEYSVAKANEAHRIAQDAYNLAELTEIENGGTGARTPEQARNNLNAYSKEEVDALIATGGEGNVVGVAGGGTGATTAKQARNNLGVPSTAEVASAINEATPNATETVAGKAKIATTAIAQEGENDTDFITPKKLLDFIKSNVIKNDFVDVKASRIQGVVYTNPSSSSYLNVRINAVVPPGGFVEAYVSDKLEMKTVASGGGSWGEYIFLLVPPLGTYKLVAAGSSISYWGEA